MRLSHFEGAEKKIGFVRRQRCLSFDVDDGRLGDETHPLAWPAVADGRHWCCASCLRIRLRRRSPRAILEAALDHRRRGLLHFWCRGHVDRYWQLWQHGCRRTESSSKSGSFEGVRAMFLKACILSGLFRFAAAALAPNCGFFCFSKCVPGWV